MLLVEVYGQIDSLSLKPRFSKKEIMFILISRKSKVTNKEHLLNLVVTNQKNLVSIILRKDNKFFAY